MSLIRNASRSEVFACYFDVLILLCFGKNFRKSVVEHECFFKCCATELESERCIANLLDRVVQIGR